MCSLVSVEYAAAVTECNNTDRSVDFDSSVLGGFTSRQVVGQKRCVVLVRQRQCSSLSPIQIAVIVVLDFCCFEFVAQFVESGWQLTCS